MGEAILFKSTAARAAVWRRRFAEQLPELEFRVWPAIGDPEDIRYLAAWLLPDDLDRFDNLEVLFSVAAGVDQFDLSRVPAALPVVRMVEPGLVAGMAEYVTWAVLSLHRGMQPYLARQRRGIWLEDPVPHAADRGVGVMGMGELGRGALERLAPFGFPRRAWSRTPRTMHGVACFAGAAQLPAFLAGCDILVCLLPLTPQTEGLLDAKLFAALPAGAAVVNAGRGGHLVLEDLLAALDTGRLSGAVLDVTEPEPPPSGHPLWEHERVWLTPHIASSSEAEGGAAAVIANICRHRTGEALVGLIDRRQGY